MYTGCVSEVNAWVTTYRGAGCPEGTYSTNTTTTMGGPNSTDNSTGGASAGSGSAAAGASGSTPSSPAATPTSAAGVIGVPVLGAALAAAVIAAL